MKVIEAPVIKFILDNLGWIFVSLALATIIWLVASLEENPVEVQDFPATISIEFVENPDDNDMLLTTSTLRRTARVTIRAPRRSLDEITSSNIRIYADLNNLDPGTHNVELQAELINDSPSGRIIDISPSDIAVEIVTISQMEFPVRIDTTGDLLPPYRLDQMTCGQEYVSIAGPQSIVSRIAQADVLINLQTIALGSNTVSYTVRPLTISDTFLTSREIENLTIEPSILACTTVVAEIEDGANLLVNPVFEGTLPDGYIRGNFTVDPPNVFVTGDADLIETLNNSVDTMAIQLDGQTNDFSREVQLVLPEALTAQPNTVTVSIVVSPRMITQQLADIPIQPINVAPSLIVTSLVPQTVIVTIEGPEPIVNNLSVDDIRITVDLEGRNVGTFSDIPIEIEILQEIDLAALEISLQPENSSVAITSAATPTPLPIDFLGG